VSINGCHKDWFLEVVVGKSKTMALVVEEVCKMMNAQWEDSEKKKQPLNMEEENVDLY